MRYSDMNKIQPTDFTLRFKAISTLILQFSGQAAFNPQMQSRLPLFNYKPAGMSQKGFFGFFFAQHLQASTVV